MIYTCEKCTAILASDNAPEKCPVCNNTEIRRAADNEVIDYIGSIFSSPFDNGDEKDGN